jgi:hypothetical protein
MTPHAAVAAIEAEPRLPAGGAERFTGYVALGLPFASGHYLALRDFPATSIGPGYRAVWHRAPDGFWTIHTTVPWQYSCPRYFGAAVSAVEQTPRIDVTWVTEEALEVRLGERLSWRLELSASPGTRAMTMCCETLPAAAWTNAPALAAMGPMSRAMLRVGRMRLAGTAPNGQHFMAEGGRAWRITGGGATLDGHDLGGFAPLRPQAHLADFWLPQSGLFFTCRMRFSTTDPELLRRTPVVEVTP